MSTSVDKVDITARVRGGNGRIRQGMIRHLVVRLDIPQGLHVYGQPAPEGMFPLTMTVKGPPGLITLPIITPETELLSCRRSVLTCRYGMAAPNSSSLYATGELASEVRPLDGTPSISLSTCNSKPAMMMSACYQRLPVSPLPLPWTPWTFQDSPSTKAMASERALMMTPHMKRLIKRSKKQAIGLLGFILRSLKLERAGRKRLQRKIDSPTAKDSLARAPWAQESGPSQDCAMRSAGYLSNDRTPTQRPRAAPLWKFRLPAALPSKRRAPAVTR